MLPCATWWAATPWVGWSSFPDAAITNDPSTTHIVKWVSRQNSQEVCPFNRKFSRSTSEPAFRARSAGQPPEGVDPLPSDVSHPGMDSPSLIEAAFPGTA